MLPAPICFLLNLFLIVMLVRIAFSWVRMATRIEDDSPWATIERASIMVTEPVLAPLRRAIPPMRMGAGYIDLSPIIILVIVLVVC